MEQVPYIRGLSNVSEGAKKCIFNSIKNGEVDFS